MWGSEESEQAIGREAVAELHRGIAALSGELTFRWRQRHVHIEGDAAWVNAAGQVGVRLAGEATRVSSYRTTAVFVWRGGAWRWHTFSGSEPNPS
jgi:ketosteroid isomerase-like protein